MATRFGARLADFLEARGRAFRFALGFGGLIGAYKAHRWYTRSKKAALQDSLVTERAYMDFAIGRSYAGRVVFGLYGTTLPLTVENFIQLSNGYHVGGKTLGYLNTTIYHGIPGKLLAGGDTLSEAGNTTGLSIYGERFPDEDLRMTFCKEGILAMDNYGPNTNSSKFMISMRPRRKSNGKYVVFGHVEQGFSVLRKIDKCVVKNGTLTKTVRVVQCGTYNPDDPPNLPNMASLDPETLSRDAWDRKDRIAT